MAKEAAVKGPAMEVAARAAVVEAMEEAPAIHRCCKWGSCMAPALGS